VLVCYGGMAPLGIAAARSVFMRDELKVDLLVPSLVSRCRWATCCPGSGAPAGSSSPRRGTGPPAGRGAGEPDPGVQLRRAARAGRPRRRGGHADPVARQLEQGMLPQVEDIEAALARVAAG